MKPLAPRETAALRLQTLGGFRVWLSGTEIAPAAWGREKAVQLFQFLVTLRRRPLHKEEIIDRLWPDLDRETGDRDFKVALSAVNNTLEPKRSRRAAPRFIRRHGLAYGLAPDDIWIDADAFEALIVTGNHLLHRDVEAAIEHYRSAVALYASDYLPERIYDDWTSAERERLQTLALGTMTALANLVVDRNPLESLRLTQRVLTLEPAWEEAYRAQMRAYLAQGNRAMALRTYRQCIEMLDREFKIEPLPETQELYEQIKRQA